MGFIEVDVSRYLVLMGVSRILRLLFWIMMHIKSEDFLYLIFADLFHTIIVGDMVWLHFKKKKGDDRLILKI